MRMESLRDLTQDELLQKREEMRQELFTLKLRKGIKGLDNPLKLRTLRRDIARIETMLSEDRKGIRKIVDQVRLIDQISGKKDK
ncbi:MAG: 50S ribosomal protein L29 [candidate division Zixibacteria bacterium]|nr:50S ribosomal protein L29 [candidate division Zixibacteria bacterium]